jgi:hypothetical protein
MLHSIQKAIEIFRMKCPNCREKHHGAMTYDWLRARLHERWVGKALDAVKHLMLALRLLVRQAKVYVPRLGKQPVLAKMLVPKITLVAVCVTDRYFSSYGFSTPVCLLDSAHR